MAEPFTFYRAADPVKGSWDGYGFVPTGTNDFVAFVADAPSGASIHTPELIKQFWIDYCRKNGEIGRLEVADGINRLQDLLQQRSQSEGAVYQATCIVASKQGNTLYYCSIGDSTLQVFRKGKICRLSDAEVWNSGLIFDQAEKSERRSKTQTLRFVGSGGDFVSLSQVLSFPLHAHDILCLSTDGMEDLVPPDRLISLLQSQNTLRQDLETICNSQKLKDDVTFVSIDIQIPEPYSAEKRIALLSAEIAQLKKDQDRLRNEIANLTSSTQRLERMERGNQDGRPIHTAPSASRSFSMPRKSGFSKAQNWYLLALAFVLGIAATVGFTSFRNSKVPPPPITRETVTPPNSARAVVAPPEIEPARDCSYVVKKGDTLQKIAEDHKTTVQNLLRQNPVLQKNSAIQIGQEISLCGEEP